MNNLENQPNTQKLYKAYAYYEDTETPICIGHFENIEDCKPFFGLGFQEIAVYFGGTRVASFVRR